MDWFDFLTIEAISNYIVFAIGIILGVVGWLIVRWLTKKRPRKIKLLKIGESTLIEIDPEVRDDVTITYKGKAVQSFYLTTFSLHNAGEEVIDGVEVAIEFQDTEVIEVVLDDQIPGRARPENKEITDSSLKIALPFLNPHKLYKDRVEVKVFSLKPIIVKNVVGGGRGWSVEFFDRVKFQSALASDLATLNPRDYIGLARIGLRYFEAFLKIYR